MEQICFGIDIGGTAIKAGLFNAEGKLLNKWQIATDKTGDGRDIIKKTAAFIQNKIEECKITGEQVVGIGIGLPGPVRKNGEVLELPNLGLGHFNIEEELEKLTGFQVKAGNDANVAALGEMWQGSGKGFDNLVLFTLGTGIGGGIIVNGSILTGSNGAAGEIGHILVNKNEEKTCGCGKKGCLEQYASATGIVRLAKESLLKTQEPSMLRSIGDITAKNVLDCAKEGDQLAFAVVDRACEYLGIVMAHVAQIVDPEVFVIGGGVSKAGDILTDNIRKYYNMHVMPALKGKEFRIASLGNNAGIYGAAKLILASK